MISVIIPLYNKEKSIKATLESVMAQTYTDYEVIIVNDGSTDKSADVVRNFISTVKSEVYEVKNIRLIQQENAGVSAARNAGILAAQGEYVAFLDADDYWEYDVLLEFDRLINDFPDATLYALGCGNMTNDIKTPCKCDLNPGYRGYLNDIWKHRPTFLSASSCCCRRTLANQIGGFDIRMTHGEDYDMWWRLIFVGKLAFYNKTLIYYVQDAENRAMHRIPKFENQISYYIEKYAKQREQDIDFRRFCDDELARRLYPYLLDKKNKNKAKQLLALIDWKLQKPSLYWRMQSPRLYNIYFKVKHANP